MWSDNSPSWPRCWCTASYIAQLQHWGPGCIKVEVRDLWFECHCNLSSRVRLSLTKWGNSLFLPIAMIMCIVTGCLNHSGRDTGVSFYRIPSIITGKGFKKEQLSKRRREGYIAAVSQERLGRMLWEHNSEHVGEQGIKCLILNCIY